eukprot:CAMPEP_0197523224 /NCGR_PEP_ID=MMETSP1318-20131121/8197_1 /TAXON_ID=552666 /ORGANISM="Partenskyella glossopodia, Strain RCC365" /LENGTH=216 /DNA_ID=CAMNT_0043075849 /DNA_START=95 /DNA_END=742 /DNA_ORIENTATION=-
MLQGVELRELESSSMECLKLFNACVFPVKYPSKFYRDLLRPQNATYSRLAYLNEELVGAICCEIVDEKKKKVRRLCISTIGVKAEYQGRRVGSKLLEFCVAEARKDRGLQDIFLNVQTDNYDAIKFYKRFGFKRCREVKNYYRRIEKLAGFPRSKDCFEMALALKDFKLAGEKRGRDVFEDGGVPVVNTLEFLSECAEEFKSNTLSKNANGGVQDS